MGASRTKTFPWAPATGGSCNDAAPNAPWSLSATQVLTVAYHLLSDPYAHLAELGADFHDRLHPNAERGN
jgi:hypothetical protein